MLKQALEKVARQVTLREEMAKATGLEEEIVGSSH